MLKLLLVYYYHNYNFDLILCLRKCSILGIIENLDVYTLRKIKPRTPDPGVNSHRIVSSKIEVGTLSGEYSIFVQKYEAI